VRVLQGHLFSCLFSDPGSVFYLVVQKVNSFVYVAEAFNAAGADIFLSPTILPLVYANINCFLSIIATRLAILLLVRFLLYTVDNVFYTVYAISNVDGIQKR
jgi:hypothetical protein